MLDVLLGVVPVKAAPGNGRRLGISAVLSVSPTVRSNQRDRAFRSGAIAGSARSDKPPGVGGRALDAAMSAWCFDGDAPRRACSWLSRRWTWRDTLGVPHVNRSKRGH